MRAHKKTGENASLRKPMNHVRSHFRTAIKKYTSENSNIGDKTVIKNVCKVCCSYSISIYRDESEGTEKSVIEDSLIHDDLQFYIEIRILYYLTELDKFEDYLQSEEKFRDKLSEKLMQMDMEVAEFIHNFDAV